jgi:hypothetical protein
VGLLAFAATYALEAMSSRRSANSMSLFSTVFL